jgi:toxin CcdB
MAQFDFYRRRSGEGFLVDCQAPILAGLDTRFVVPLLPLEHFSKPAAHLNPVFEIAGKPFCFVAQFAATVPLKELGRTAGSLADERYRIMKALDFLLTGV